MLDVSNDFLTAIKDESKEKVVLMIVNLWSLWFTKEDFANGGITIDEYFCTTNDLTYGNTPSARCSFTLFADGVADGVNAFLYSETSNPLDPEFGVEVNRESYTFNSGVLSHIEFIPDDGESTNTVIVEGRTDGLYFNSTKIDNGVYKTLLFRGNADVVCLGDNNAALYFTCSDSAVDYIGSFTPDDFMVRKFVTNGKASWSFQYDTSDYGASRTWTTWSEGEKVTYEMVSAGYFYPDATNIRKDYLGDAITFTDIPDAMFMWDSYKLAPESALVEYLNTPQTTTYPYVQYPMYMNELANIVGNSFSYPGLQYNFDATIGSRFSAISFSENPLNSYGFSYRQLYGWMGEAARANVWCTKRGWTDIGARWLNSDPDQVETLTTSDIGIDGFNIAWYQTKPIHRVVLEHGGGGYDEFIIDPDDDSPETYVINNPLIQSMTQAEAEAFAEGIPTYYPIAFTVINANPAVEVGDMIEITGTGIGDEESFTIPLMHRRITFNGVGFTAEYEATGGYKREAYEADDLQNNVTKNAQDIADIQSAGYLTAATGVTSVNGSHGDVTVSNNKVTQTYAAYSGYTYWRPLVIGYSSGSAEGFTPSTQTNTTYTFSNLKVQPSTGTLKATIFKGNLTGDVTGTASGNLTSSSTLDPTKLSGVSSGTTKFLREDGTWKTPNYPPDLSSDVSDIETVLGEFVGFKRASLATSASRTLTFKSGATSRCVLFFTGTSVGTKGMYIVTSSSTGSVSVVAVSAGSNLSYTTSTYTLTFTNSSTSNGSYIEIMIFAGDVTYT